MSAHARDAEATLLEVGTGRPRRISEVWQLPTALSRLEPGAVVGRYVVVKPIGKGGMGAVALAYDTQLARKVAIKALLADPSEDQQSTMLREAQAMARLSHPNVVTIYDVGVHDGTVFLAMEYLEGVTLRAWLKAGRSRRDVLSVLKKAGRGLAAAHAAGIVHRDFKPSNVVIADDGRVCVIDFGVARRIPRASRAEIGALSSMIKGVIASTAPPAPLTMTDGVIGTIGYLAPEQILSSKVDARADVFSLCVTLWRALYGALPFSSASLCDYGVALREGPKKPDAAPHLPGWLHAVLLRGLAVDPADRFQSMGELLAALDADPRPKRTAIAAVAAVTAAALVTAAGVHQHGRNIATACRAEGDAVASEWAARRDAVGASLRGETDALAGERAARALQLVDDYVGASSEQEADSCLATRLSRTQTESVREIRGECLLRGRQQLATIEDMVVDGDRLARRQVLDLLDDLPQPGLCGDKDALALHVPLPSDAAARESADRARRELARARVLDLSGHRREAVDEARAARTHAHEAGDTVTEAQAALRAGMIDVHRRDLDAGVGELSDAISIAERIGDDRMVAMGETRIAFAFAAHLFRPDLARPWQELAEATLSRIGPSAEPGYYVASSEAVIASEGGDFDETIALYGRVIDAARALYGDGAGRVCNEIANRGLVYAGNGMPREAAASMREAIACADRGDGHYSPSLSGAHGNLVDALLKMGEYREALAESRKVMALQQDDDPSSPLMALVYVNEGEALLGLSRPGEAERDARRALDIARGANDAAFTSAALYVLGEARAAQDDPKGARDACASAVQIVDPPSPEKFYEEDRLRCLGEAELALGDVAAARDHLGQSARLPKRRWPGDLARARFALARALATRDKDVGTDLPGAAKLAQQARDDLRAEVGEYPALRPLLERIELWPRAGLHRRRGRRQP